MTEAFRRGAFRTLVVTELAARGLDLPDCDLVVNLGLPEGELSYAHRWAAVRQYDGAVSFACSCAQLRGLFSVAEPKGLVWQQRQKCESSTTAPLPCDKRSRHCSCPGR